MSGGSFNYLCYKDEDELFNHQFDLDQMATELIELGFLDAAKETLATLAIIKQALTRVRVAKQRLDEVWKAVEWYRSGDCSEKDVQAAIAEYRGEVTPND